MMHIMLWWITVSACAVSSKAVESTVLQITPVNSSMFDGSSILLPMSRQLFNNTLDIKNSPTTSSPSGSNDGIYISGSLVMFIIILCCLCCCFKYYCAGYLEGLREASQQHQQDSQQILPTPPPGSHTITVVRQLTMVGDRPPNQGYMGYEHPGIQHYQ